MGNRRKILAAIFGVVLLAVGTVSGALFAFKPRTVADTPIANAATTVSNGGSATISGTKRNGGETATFNVTNGRIYLVEIAGQSGKSVGSGNGGRGYIIRGYYKATSSSASGYIGEGGGSDVDYNHNYIGGGYSSFPINFGRPKTTISVGYAGGGGAAGRHTDGYSFSGGDAGFYRGETALSSDYQTGGGGATQSAPGVGGKMKTSSPIYAKDGNNGSGSRGGRPVVCGDREAGIAASGGGGGGYYGGGSGAASTSMGRYNRATGGGGGSCSPNTYAVGLNNTNDYGYITVYDVTPTKNPAGSTVSYPNTATITDGSVGNSSVGSRQWQYSTDNATWSTTKPTQTAIGTKTVYWRYVITESNVASTECVIASGSVDLTVTKANPTVSAPTLTGNGSATYSGNNIQVVTAAGQSSGTFTFATVKTKDEE